MIISRPMKLEIYNPLFVLLMNMSTMADSNAWFDANQAKSRSNGYLELPGIIIAPASSADLISESPVLSGWNTNEWPSHDNNVSSDPTIKFIGDVLLKEKIEEKPFMYDNIDLLRETEISFYDAIGEKYPPELIGGRSTLNFEIPAQTQISHTCATQMVHSMFSNNDSLFLFNKGVEEARKFLPNPGHFNVSICANKARRIRERDENDERGLTKQSAIYAGDDFDDRDLSEMLDRVVLVNPARCDYLKNRIKEFSTRSRSKRRGNKNQSIDLPTQLILCAQAMSASDFRTAGEILKQIRSHSSKTGDGTQRLAHYFANGLEARLAGNTAGLQNYYGSLLSQRISTAEWLKAFQTLITSIPMMRFTTSYMNAMIESVSCPKQTLHIIDFGILYGYQWPSLIQSLTSKPGRVPPKLRITGIEVPQSGFRPTELIEEAGKRLANYCKRFHIEFEYNCMAESHWENIKVEDLKIRENETVVVNCLFRMKNILDETGEKDCPRDAFLSKIREMRPDLFCYAESNGAYNSPFFATRFKEALFHFSAVFDALDSSMAADEPEREVLEADFCGKELMNAVACEGEERMTRPETYKQWHMRTRRAGFKEVPLDEDLIKIFRTKLGVYYHKDFIIDQDGHWLLQGWKGRILMSTSCWTCA